MANHFVDKSEDFIKSGMTLISEPAADRILNRIHKQKYQVPDNRLSRQCGGAGGFDDYVERFDE